MEESNEYLRAIRRNWAIPVVAMALGLLAMFFTTPAKPKLKPIAFRAIHTILLNQRGESPTISTNQLSLFTTVGEVPKRVADLLHWKGKPAELAAQVTANLDASNGTFTVSSQQNEPKRAEELADTFAAETVRYLNQQQDQQRQERKAAAQLRLTRLQKQVDDLDARLAGTPNSGIVKAQRDAAIVSYSTAFQQAQTVNDDTSGIGMNTLQRAQAIPIQAGGFRAPSSRRARVPIGGFFGLMGGFGLILLLERFDGRVRDRRRAELALGSPVIAELPTIDRRHRGSKLLVRPDAGSNLAEAYRTLRTALTFLAQDETTTSSSDGRVGVILVSSPSPGDGKTTTAANVAAAFAETGRSVAVVNADFRRPSISPYLGPTRSLSALTVDQVLNAPLRRLIQPSQVEGIWVLDLAGVDAPPGDLARIAARLVEQIMDQVDVVIVDTPPLSVTAEALEFVSMAAISLIIARVGRTRVRSAERARELLQFTGAKQIAVALTDTGKPSRRRYQYYRYANYASALPPSALDEPRPRRVPNPFNLDRSDTSAPVSAEVPVR